MRSKFLNAFAVLASIALFSVSMFAAHSVSLSWTASVDSGSTYNVYRISGTCPVGTPTSLTGWTKLTPTPIAPLTFTDGTVTAGSFCYDVTAILNGNESTPSNDPQATIPVAPPTNVTITNQQ